MPATNSAAALIENSPGFTVNGAPGVKSTRVWVWDDQRDTRDPPGPKTGYDGTLGGEGKGCGGSAQRSSPAQHVRAFPGSAQGFKRCARPRCGTGEPVRGSCGAVRGCSELATVRLRCGRRRSTGVPCFGVWDGLRALRSSAKGRGGRGDAHRGLGMADA